MHATCPDATALLLLRPGDPVTAGTGKTVLAGALADRLGFTALSSDRIRKELAGVPAEQRCAAPWGTGIYAAAWTERVYSELLARAGRLLALGEPVIADASFTSPAQRAAAAQAAASTHAELVQLRCTAPAEVTAQRLTARTGGASDVDTDIARQIAAVEAPWPQVVTIDTSQLSPDTAPGHHGGAVGGQGHAHAVERARDGAGADQERPGRRGAQRPGGDAAALHRTSGPDRQQVRVLIGRGDVHQVGTEWGGAVDVHPPEQQGLRAAARPGSSPPRNTGPSAPPWNRAGPTGTLRYRYGTNGPGGQPLVIGSLVVWTGLRPRPDGKRKAALPRRCGRSLSSSARVPVTALPAG